MRVGEVAYPQYANNAPTHQRSKVAAGLPVALRIVDGIEKIPVPIIRFAMSADPVY